MLTTGERGCYDRTKLSISRIKQQEGDTSQPYLPFRLNCPISNPYFTYEPTRQVSQQVILQAKQLATNTDSTRDETRDETHSVETASSPDIAYEPGFDPDLQTTLSYAPIPL